MPRTETIKVAAKNNEKLVKIGCRVREPIWRKFKSIAIKYDMYVEDLLNKIIEKYVNEEDELLRL